MSDPISDINEPAERVRVEDPSKLMPELARWIRTHYHTKKWARLELRHLSPSGADHVETWEEFEGVSPEQILRNLYNSAMEDGKNFKGVQKYGVFFYEENKNAPMRKLFQIKGADYDEDDGFGGESEPANAKGLLAQHMRFTTDIMRVAMTGTREQAHILKSLLGETMAINDKLMSRHFEVLDLHEKLLDKTTERDIKREDEKSTREVKKVAMGMLAQQGIQMLPALMNKLLAATGGTGTANLPVAPQQVDVHAQPIPPAGAPPAAQVGEKSASEAEVARTMELLKFVVGSLTEQQVMKMMENFSDVQKQAFVELYGELLRQDQAKAAAAPSSAATTTPLESAQDPITDETSTDKKETGDKQS